jgi:hypothetical protein
VQIVDLAVFGVLHGPTRFNNLYFFLLFEGRQGKNEFLDNIGNAA